MYTFVKTQNKLTGRPSSWHLLISSTSELIEWHENLGTRMSPYTLMRLAVTYDVNNRYDPGIIYDFNKFYSKAKNKLTIIELKRLIGMTGLHGLCRYDIILASEGGNLCIHDSSDFIEEVQNNKMAFPKTKGISLE